MLTNRKPYLRHREVIVSWTLELALLTVTLSPNMLPILVPKLLYPLLLPGSTLLLASHTRLIHSLAMLDLT